MFVTFKDPKMYEILYNLKNFGIRGEETVVDVGANAKMNEFCAAMGLCNLKNIDKVLMERKEKYEYDDLERIAKENGLSIKEIINNI